MDLKIIVATHKKYDIPKEDYLFPVFAGSALSDLDLPYQRDDEGINISDKNKYYCELTALYWAYENLEADFIGLCHYRRYFDLKRIDLTKTNVVLPKKRHYYIETVYDQFKHAHGSEGLDVTRKVLQEMYPDYISFFDEQMKKRSLHIYNMFIMKYETFKDYCFFIFSVLSEVEKKIGNIDRIYGYIGERLLDVYINKNKIKYIETKVISVEKIDWIKKVYLFIKRKYKM